MTLGIRCAVTLLPPSTLHLKAVAEVKERDALHARIMAHMSLRGQTILRSPSNPTSSKPQSDCGGPDHASKQGA